MQFNFQRKLTLITLTTILLTACQTVPESGNDKTSKSNAANVSDIWHALSLEPVSIGAAINGARIVMMDYDRKLSRADKTRKGFNLASIASTTYTAVGAALNIHNHNLIVSTAISTILPKVEENVHSHGSPETLGSAMTKTQCVIRAGTLALSPKTLEAASIIRESTKQTQTSDYQNAKAALTAYTGVKDRIVSGYGQVYIDYAASRTPVQLNTEKLAEALSVISQDEVEAQNKASDEHTSAAVASLFTGNKNNLSQGFSGRRIASHLVQDLSVQIAILNTAAEASIAAITDCTKTS